MPELREIPFLRFMAGGTIVAEKAEVAVVVAVAGGAVEHALGIGKCRVNECRRDGSVTFRSRLFEPSQKSGGFVAAVIGGLLKLASAYLCQDIVIHRGDLRVLAAVFGVAVLAVSHIRVKGGGLALEDALVIGMADSTVHGLHPFYRGVAGTAVVIEKGVGFAEFAGVGHALPGGTTAETLPPILPVIGGEIASDGDDCENDTGDEDGNFKLHENQRRPKWMDAQMWRPSNP